MSSNAFLIAAHHEPLMLARLVRQLDTGTNHVFIHIDRKSDIAPFRAAVPPSERVTFLEGKRRVHVHWGGFSLVRATLNLLEAAAGDKGRFNRFTFLSGADFPIKPASEFPRVLDSDLEYLHVGVNLTTDEANPLARIVRRYYFRDRRLPGPLKRWLMYRVKIPRRPYQAITSYHGSAFWSLTAPCVDYILGFVRRHRDYSRFHRWTFLPEEVFFQSIVKSSPFADRISHDFEQLADGEALPANEYALTFIDWDVGDSFHPALLTERHYEAIARSPCLFARKFDERESAALRARLERDLLKAE